MPLPVDPASHPITTAIALTGLSIALALSGLGVSTLYSSVSPARIEENRKKSAMLWLGDLGVVMDPWRREVDIETLPRMIGLYFGARWSPA
jgi:hypothetical protein